MCLNNDNTDFKELKIKQEKELKREKENNPIKYYKSFNKKHFRKKNIDSSDEDDLILSSTESESESSEDNYPCPNTKKTYDYIQQLKDKINKLKIKYKKLELKIKN